MVVRQHETTADADTSWSNMWEAEKKVCVVDFTEKHNLIKTKVDLVCKRKCLWFRLGFQVLMNPNLH